MTTPKSRLAEARTLLRFYAAKESYHCKMIYKACGCLQDWPNTPVLIDGGEKARAWLAHNDEQEPEG